ncbi:hypothetical protein [Agarilytica rhodophyticola]|uniref:hypothetical protein n=1 Tax=Agarilytica rhodophyticola TaxID=1737490 RepID=UPI00131588D1|nr:hypothetical protein [Agarilytica rhodophyticola]
MNLREYFMYIRKYLMRFHSLLSIVILIIFSLAIVRSIIQDTNKSVNADYKILFFPVFNNEVRFGIIEAALSKIKLDLHGELELNAKSESSLSKAEASLPENISKKSLDRVSFLITKSFVGVKGELLADVFLKYHKYKNAERKTISRYSDEKTLIEERRQLDEKSYLQKKYLGHQLSRKLFGKQNEFAKLFLKMRIAESNNDLSDDERKTEMLRLQKEINDLMQESS